MYKIALDGPPGTGKSTLAKKIAEKMKIKYLDSGAIYRAFTLYCILNQIDTDDSGQIESALKEFSLEMKEGSIFINGTEYTEEIRKSYVSKNIWRIAANVKVRKYVVQYCRNYAQGHSVVMDGRDIGTHVFPETPYKFYILANLDVRAERRLKDMKNNGEDIGFDELKEMIREREEQEKNRKVSPLVKAPKAIEIDTSYGKVEELADEIIEHVKKIERGL